MDISISKLKSYVKISFIIYLLAIKFHFMDFNLQIIDNVFFIGGFALLSIIFSVESFIYHYKNKTLKFNSVLILAALFIILCLVTTYINAKKLPLMLLSYDIILFYLMMYIDTSRVSKEYIEKEKNIILNILSYSISISLIIGLILAFLETKMNMNIFNYPSFFQETRYVGIIGFNQNPVTVASSTLVGLIASAILYAKNKKIHYFIFTTVDFIALLLTDSRSSLLGLIGLSFIIAIYFFIKTKNKKVVILSVIALIFLLIGFSYYNSTKSPIRSLNVNPSESTENQSATSTEEEPKIILTQEENNFLIKLSNGRYYLYREAVILGMKSPIIGNGLNTFVSNSVKEFGKGSYAVVFTNEDPHNIVLSVFYYTGIVGLIIVGLIFVEIFKNSFKLLKNMNLEDYIMVGAIFGFLIVSFFDYNMFIRVNFYPGIYWALVGYIFAFNKFNDASS